MKKNNNNSFLLLFIIFLTSFLLWFHISSIYKEKWNVVLLKTEKNNAYSKDASILNFDKFNKTYDYIKNNFYGFEEVEKEKLSDSILAWLVDWLWDKHSEYLNKEENSSFSELLNWEFEWIWAFVASDPMWVRLDMIFKGSPAKKFWLLKDDIIISANSTKLAWLPLKEAISHIKWPAWTKVSLEIYREWEKDLLKKEVVRNKVEIPSIETEKLENNLWYISLSTFWDKTDDDFKKALDSFKNTDWIIIDLRENGWWYLEIAVKILSNFIENWKDLVITKWKWEKIEQVLKSINSWDIYKWKIVVLINENSASASEITAWTLRDYNKAILIWKKSYWKGSVQVPFDLHDGSMVKLTVAKWFTPLDKNIDSEWIEPDIEVDFKKEDYDLEECKKVSKCDKDMEQKDFKWYDRQKEEAIKLLKIFVEKKALQLSVDEYKESEKVEE